MAQRLIVEGKDAYALSAILQRNEMPLPRGYTALSYRKEFIKSAGGIDNIRKIIKEEINSPDVTHIGIVVDANDVGANRRLQSILDVIRALLPSATPFPEGNDLNTEGWVENINNDLRIGIWVMPDKETDGYLEHFLVRLIPEDDTLLLATRDFLHRLRQNQLLSFPDRREEKALLATYLAIQEELGMNASTAISRGHLVASHELALRFTRWFRSTFILQDE